MEAQARGAANVAQGDGFPIFVSVHRHGQHRGGLVRPNRDGGRPKAVYNVQHSRYGNIGTYTNAVEKTGRDNHRCDDAHIQVSLLGSSSTPGCFAPEHWRNRLMPFTV